MVGNLKITGMYVDDTGNATRLTTTMQNNK